LFEAVLVTLFSQRDRLPVPSLPFTSLISGYQPDRIALGVEDIRDADLAAPGGARPQFFQIGQPRVVDAVGERSAQFRPASSSMPMAWPTWIALARSRVRKLCSHARTSCVMTRASAMSDVISHQRDITWSNGAVSRLRWRLE
jgi:hypothetical protein